MAVAEADRVAVKLFLVISLVSLNPTTLALEQYVEATEMASERACVAERDRYRRSPVWSKWAFADCLSAEELARVGRVVMVPRGTQR